MRQLAAVESKAWLRIFAEYPVIEMEYSLPRCIVERLRRVLGEDNLAVTKVDVSHTSWRTVYLTHLAVLLEKEQRAQFWYVVGRAGVGWGTSQFLIVYESPQLAASQYLAEIERPPEDFYLNLF